MELVSWNELRLRKQLCDGVIKTADGSSFPIHRVIVSSFSPYFRVYFTNSLHEGQPEYTEMNLPDVPAYIVSMIVEFAYTHRCQVTTSFSKRSLQSRLMKNYRHIWPVFSDCLNETLIRKI